MQVTIKTEWTKISDELSNDVVSKKPNFIHCDTRDFAVTYNNTADDTIYNIINKYPKETYNDAYIHVSMIIPYLQSIRTYMRSNNLLMLKYNVPQTPAHWFDGWVKYIRFVYMEDGYYCMYTTCGDNYHILPVNIYNIENIKKNIC